MQLVNAALDYLKDSITYSTTMDLGDIFEVIIIAFLMYYILVWM